MEYHLVQNQKENCHHDHIPFNMKGNGNIVFSVRVPEITLLRRTQLAPVSTIKNLLDVNLTIIEEHEDIHRHAVAPTQRIKTKLGTRHLGAAEQFQ